MKATPQERSSYLAGACLLVLACLTGAVSLPAETPLELLAIGAAPLLCLAAIAGWFVSLKRRITHTAIRRCFIGIAVLMGFWIMLRTYRHHFTFDHDPGSIFAWYLYYVPMLLIPLLGLLSAMRLNKPDDAPVHFAGKAAALITLALLTLVLTNNLHELVFTFPGPLRSTEDHGYAAGYFCVLGWMLLMGAAALVNLIGRCLVSTSRKRAWLPLLVLAGLATYAGLYVAGLFNNLPEDSLDLTMVFCTFTIALCEASIQTGLIPCNSHYDQLFRATTAPAQIKDPHGNVAYQTATWPSLKPLSHYPKLANCPEHDCAWQIDANTLLLKHAISSGHVLWLQDYSSLNEAKRKLEHTKAQLQDATQVLRAEAQAKEEAARTAAANQLFDRIATDLQQPIEELQALLNADQGNSIGTAQELRALRAACITGAYLKRRANLVVLEQGAQRIPGQELVLCLRESGESLKACGIASHLQASAQGTLHVHTATAAYDLLHHCLKGLGTLQHASILTNARITEGHVNAKVTIDAAWQASPDAILATLRQNTLALSTDASYGERPDRAEETGNDRTSNDLATQQSQLQLTQRDRADQAAACYAELSNPLLDLDGLEVGFAANFEQQTLFVTLTLTERNAL